MDAYKATRIVYSRVQVIDPNHASKLMASLLLQDDSDQEMFRLAFSHDAVLQAMVMKSKKELGLSSSTRNANLFSAAPPLPENQFSSPAFHHVGSPAIPAPLLPANFNNEPFGNSSSFFNDQTDRIPLMRHSDPAFLNGPDNPRLKSTVRFPDPQFLTLDKFPDHLSRNDMQLGDQCIFFERARLPAEYMQHDAFTFLNGKLGAHDGFQSRFNREHFSSSDLVVSPDSLGSSGAAWKPCLYFARGFCKHGNNFKILHSYGSLESGFYLS